MERKLYDFHSHFLPGMDDGCKTPEESVKLLKNSFAQGVRWMFATPHYYPVEPVEAFLERREAAHERLLKALEGQTDIPQFALGAEVAYRPGIGYEPALEKLCLGDPRYILLEMPFSKWGSSAIRDVSNICSTRGLTPIIAHMERYLHYQSSEILRSLWQQDILVQMNAGYLLDFWSRRKALRLLKNGTVDLLGSDAHNNTSRPQNLRHAAAFLERKGETALLDRVIRTSAAVFDAAKEK